MQISDLADVTGALAYGEGAGGAGRRGGRGLEVSAVLAAGRTASQDDWKNIKKIIDRDRTRTCNPQIRSLMPYPLGHTATDESVLNK